MPRARVFLALALFAVPVGAAPSAGADAPPAPAATAEPGPAPAPESAPVTDVPPVSGPAAVTDVVPPAAQPPVFVAPPPATSRERPPVVDLSPPERQPRIHGGFYLGFQSGPAYFSATSEWENGSTGNPGTREFSGPSLGFSLALGGTFANRIALCGLITFEPVLSLSAKDENGETLDVEDVSFFLRGEGILLDYYLSPSGGFHMLAALGFAQLDVDRSGSTQNDPQDPTGSFWTLGAGYDWWVGENSSLGVLARLSNASLETSETSEDVDVEVFSFGLHVTATMN